MHGRQCLLLRGSVPDSGLPVQAAVWPRSPPCLPFEFTPRRSQDMKHSSNTHCAAILNLSLHCTAQHSVESPVALRLTVARLQPSDEGCPKTGTWFECLFVFFTWVRTKRSLESLKWRRIETFLCRSHNFFHITGWGSNVTINHSWFLSSPYSN